MRVTYYEVHPDRQRVHFQHKKTLELRMLCSPRVLACIGIEKQIFEMNSQFETLAEKMGGKFEPVKIGPCISMGRLSGYQRYGM